MAVSKSDEIELRLIQEGKETRTRRKRREKGKIEEIRLWITVDEEGEENEQRRTFWKSEDIFDHSELAIVLGLSSQGLSQGSSVLLSIASSKTASDAG